MHKQSMAEELTYLLLSYYCSAHRYEIIFAMATTVYLLFATMHNTKESLEHFLLEGHHGKEHHEESTFGFGMFLAMGVAIGTCCLAGVALRNHDNFVRCKWNNESMRLGNKQTKV